jgi:hypothetical protein
MIGGGRKGIAGINEKFLAREKKKKEMARDGQSEEKKKMFWRSCRFMVSSSVGGKRRVQGCGCVPSCRPLLFSFSFSPTGGKRVVLCNQATSHYNKTRFLGIGKYERWLCCPYRCPQQQQQHWLPFYPYYYYYYYKENPIDNWIITSNRKKRQWVGTRQRILPILVAKGEQVNGEETESFRRKFPRGRQWKGNHPKSEDQNTTKNSPSDTTAYKPLKSSKTTKPNSSASFYPRQDTSVDDNNNHPAKEDASRQQREQPVDSSPSSSEPSSQKKKRRKNNLYVYHMHLEQQRNNAANNQSQSSSTAFADSSRSILLPLPDNFSEAKVLYDEKAFNRLAPKNFIRVEPWRWKHFPFEERFQRLVKPKSNMWIKRTNSKDVVVDSSSRRSTDVNSRQQSSVSYSSERRKKNTVWRKTTSDSLEDHKNKNNSNVS